MVAESGLMAVAVVAEVTRMRTASWTDEVDNLVYRTFAVAVAVAMVMMTAASSSDAEHNLVYMTAVEWVA